MAKQKEEKESELDVEKKKYKNKRARKLSLIRLGRTLKFATIGKNSRGW